MPLATIVNRTLAWLVVASVLGVVGVGERQICRTGIEIGPQTPRFLLSFYTFVRLAKT